MPELACTFLGDDITRSGAAPSDIIKQKEADWSAFIHNRVISPTVNPTIAQSWIRSKAAGIDPYHITPPMLSEDELRALRKKNAVLLEYALPLMRKLKEVGNDQIFLMSLHDRDGYMLECLVDDDSWTDPQFRPGVRWQEQDVGTNGLGLVLIEKMPVQIVGQEHYSAVHHNVVCCASPIFGGNGELTAVLNMTTKFENYSNYQIQLAILLCQAVSNQLKDHAEFELDESIFRSISEGVLVLDKHQTLIRCNERAAQIFGCTAEVMLGCHIQDVINIPNYDACFAQKSGSSLRFRECSSYFNSRHTVCDVTVTPVISNEADAGVVVIVRNSKQYFREIAAVTGQCARYTFDDILTRSPEVLALVARMKEAADRVTPILLQGEHGTGKEVYAHAMHAWSSRRDMPFCSLNCASMPPAALSCDLFGCERSEFAGQTRKGSFGKLEIAEGGTVFLDAVECLSYEMQERLLSVLNLYRLRQESGDADAPQLVRLIAATHENLADAVRKNLFSEDLYQMLSGTTFQIPPLRARPEDILLLAEDQLARLNQKTHKEKVFSEQALATLQSNPWPGNIRQLQDLIVRAFYMTDADCITALPLQKQAPEKRTVVSEGPEALNSVERSERAALIACLSACGNDVQRAAAELGVSRATLYRHLKKYGIVLRGG